MLPSQPARRRSNTQSSEGGCTMTRMICSSRVASATVVAVLLGTGLSLRAQALPEVQSVLTMNAGGVITVVIEANGPLPMPTAGTAENPPRIFIDFAGVTSRRRGIEIGPGYGVVQQTRVALNSINVTRVVLDLTKMTSYRLDANALGEGRLKIVLGPEPSTASAAPKPRPVPPPTPVEPTLADGGHHAAPTPTAPVTAVPPPPAAPAPAPTSPAPGSRTPASPAPPSLAVAPPAGSSAAAASPAAASPPPTAPSPAQCRRHQHRLPHPHRPPQRRLRRHRRQRPRPRRFQMCRLAGSGLCTRRRHQHPGSRHVTSSAIGNGCLARSSDWRRSSQS